MAGKALLIAVALIMAPVPTSAIDFRNAPDERFTGQVEAVLLAYRDQRRGWPANMKELQRFARQNGHLLDLSSFSKVALTRKSSNTIYVEYATKPPQATEGGFAVTVIDVPPAQ